VIKNCNCHTVSDGSFKMSIKLAKQFLGHMEKFMYGLNVKSKIMVHLSTSLRDTESDSIAPLILNLGTRC